LAERLLGSRAGLNVSAAPLRQQINADTPTTIVPRIIVRISNQRDY
jgi:hypothetical protein